MQKTAAAIHDFSGFGKCSLTVILPVLSAAGIACSAAPTAILSSHTGGLPNVYVQDFTEGLHGFTRQWTELPLSFDAIYTGYMSSPEQVEACAELTDVLRKPGTLFVADPALGDNGSLYSGVNKATASAMARFCCRADLILPNLTVAALLLGEKPNLSPTRAEVEELLQKLAALGPRRVAITGVSFSPRKIGAACYDALSHETAFAFAPCMEGHYHGTGDLFGAALLGGLLRGLQFREAMQAAVSFVSRCVWRTKQNGTDPRFGLDFEEELPFYLHALSVIM